MRPRFAAASLFAGQSAAGKVVGMNVREVVFAIAGAVLLGGGCIVVVVWRWAWLSAPQNSTAVQAAVALAVGVPTVVFAGVATLAAIESARSSAKQSKAADRQAEAAIVQAEAAREQINLSEFQFREQQKHFEAQQRIDRKHELAAYSQLVAEDDATRPRFTISGGYSVTNGAGVELKNIGGGDAIDLSITVPNTTKKPISYSIVRAGTVIRCNLDLVDMQMQPAKFVCTSQLGSRWELEYRMTPGLTEVGVSVVRPYELEPDQNGPRAC